MDIKEIFLNEELVHIYEKTFGFEVKTLHENRDTQWVEAPSIKALITVGIGYKSITDGKNVDKTYTTHW